MKKSRNLILLLLAVLLVGILAACGGTTGGGEAATDEAETTEATETTEAAETSDGGVQVGIVLPTKDEPRWLQDQAQFESLLGDAGFTSQVLFSQGNSATEKTNVETLISNGAKVIIICPQDGDAAASTVSAAQSAGAKVISYDRFTPGADYLIEFNSVSVGEAQAQYLVDHAPSGSGVPLYLYAGAATDNNAFLFFEGAWNVLQPKIADGTFVIANSSEAEALKDKAELTRDEMSKIIGQVTTDWDFNVAKSKAEAHLTANGADLKGDVLVLAPNDGTARSIADVFASDADVKSYVVTGQDLEDASIQYIIDGKQSMTVWKNTNTLAGGACDMAAALVKGDTPTTNAEYEGVPAQQFEVTVVDQANVKDVIEQSGKDASSFTGLS